MNESTPPESEIYERVVAAILDHRLTPGTKLAEDRLATAFGVSRTRIRPVLVRLANEQIVTLTPNRGATVAQPNEREAREVFEVRRMIEPLLIGFFITQAAAQETDILARCIASEEDARSRGDLRRSVRLSGDFHLHIANASGHQTLGRILRELVSRTSLILMTYSRGHSLMPTASSCLCQEHRGLLDAIRLRDAPLACSLMREHLVQLESQLRFTLPASQAPDLVRLFAQVVPDQSPTLFA